MRISLALRRFQVISSGLYIAEDRFVCARGWCARETREKDSKTKMKECETKSRKIYCIRVGRMRKRVHEYSGYIQPKRYISVRYRYFVIYSVQSWESWESPPFSTFKKLIKLVPKRWFTTLEAPLRLLNVSLRVPNVEGEGSRVLQQRF